MCVIENKSVMGDEQRDFVHLYTQKHNKAHMVKWEKTQENNKISNVKIVKTVKSLN